jgi:GLPGLI family protein
MNMKNLYPLLLAFMLVASLSAFSQKRFSEGTLYYDIIINTGTDKTQSADFLDGATNAIYVKGNKSRTDMVSPLGTQSTIIDGSKNLVVLLKEYGEQKFMINMTPENWKDANKRFENVQFTPSDTATKTIIGYKCKKAVGILQDGSSFTVWYTTDLVIENNDFQYATRSLPGIALEYETAIDNLKVTYSVSKISFGPVPAAKFDIPKSGYRTMTYEQSKKGN